MPFQKHIQFTRFILNKGVFLITNKFMDMGINVSFVKLKGKDPSEIGYEKMTSELFNSQRVNFKELMRMKLYGNK